MEVTTNTAATTEDQEFAAALRQMPSQKKALLGYAMMAILAGENVDEVIAAMLTAAERLN